MRRMRQERKCECQERERDREQMCQERERERQEAMAREECLAAESWEDRSLVKSRLGQSQSNMTTTHTPSQPRSSHVDLSSVVGKNGVGKMSSFHGAASTWPDWWESFKRRIDETEANPIDKLDALRMLLEGPALRKISHLGCIAEAYEDAKDILQGFYGNTTEQLNSAWCRFDSLTPVDMDDIEGLEHLLDEARSSAALLRCLGEAKAGLNTNVRILMQRIPEAVSRRILEKRIVNQEHTRPTMEEYLDSLTTEIRISRASSQGTSSTTQLLHGSASFPATELAAPSNYKKPAAETSGKGRRTRKAKRWTCFFCSKDHTAWNCRLKLHSRKAAAEKRDLCLSCLRPQHAKPGDCKYFRKVCLECSATHHPLLCPARDKQLKSAASRVKDSENEEQTETEESQSSVASVANMCPGDTLGDTTPSVIMATFQADVLAPDGSTFPVNLYVDQGAIYSVIRLSLAQQHKLKVQGHAILDQGRAGTMTWAKTPATCVSLDLRWE